MTISVDESTLIHKDGHKVDFEFNASNFTYNEKLAILVIVRDITDRKRADEALHQYEHIVSSSTDMLALLDKQFNYLAVNKVYAEAFLLMKKLLQKL